MSKSILVIDTPKRCLDCPLGNSEESDGEEVWCYILDCTSWQKGIYEDEEEEELYNSEKPDWCPLKKLSEKEDAKKALRYRPTTGEYEYFPGWDDGIDEILK